MARTKQGVFKELLNRFRAIEREYNDVVNEYQKDPSMVDFFSALAYRSDSLYTDLTQLTNDIHGMLMSTAMEQPENKEKYQGMEKNLLDYRYELVHLFRDRVNAIRDSGGYLSSSEQGTLDGLTIR